MDKNNIKIVIAVVCLLIAGVVVAWQLGVFGSGSSPRPATTDFAIEDDSEDGQPRPRRSEDIINEETGQIIHGGEDAKFRQPPRRNR